VGAIWRYIHTRLKFRGVTMAVPDQVPFNQYTASGVSASFTYSFKILDADQLLIKLDGVAQTTGFAVGGVAADAGGVVTFSAAPAAGVLVELIRSTPASRSTDYAPNGDLQESVLDADFDRAYMALQEMQEQVDRTMKLPQGATGSLDLDELVSDAFLRVNSAGNAITQVNVLTPSGSFTVSPFAETLLDDVSASAMRTTLDVMSTANVLASGAGRLVDVQVFNTAGTFNWINPYYLGGCTSTGIVEIIVVGGGASGGGAANSTASNIAVGANGGGGAYMHAIIAASRLGATETVTVGAGGAAVANSAGNAGGISKFSASGSQYIQCTGGHAGTNLANGNTVGLATGGLGGSVTWPGSYWNVLKVQNGQQGDLSRRLSGTEVITGKGGDSLHGMGGTMAGNSVGFGAIGVGGGGSGSVCIDGATGNYSGGGQIGIVIVKTYY